MVVVEEVLRAKDHEKKAALVGQVQHETGVPRLALQKSRKGHVELNLAMSGHH